MVFQLLQKHLSIPTTTKDKPLTTSSGHGHGHGHGINNPAFRKQSSCTMTKTEFEADMFGTRSTYKSYRDRKWQRFRTSVETILSIMFQTYLFIQFITFLLILTLLIILKLHFDRKGGNPLGEGGFKHLKNFTSICHSEGVWMEFSWSWEGVKSLTNIFIIGLGKLLKNNFN